MSESPGGEGTQPEPSRRRWGVPIAEVVLVAAVWVSLQLAGRDPGDRPQPVEVDPSVPAALPGFRADAWYLPDDSLLGFVEIPGGPFLMGSDSTVDHQAYQFERWSASEAQGRVDVPTFYMGRYEVTVAQYTEFVRIAGHPVRDPSALEAPPDHPVTAVAWTDALAYVRWLDRQLREGPGVPAALQALLDAGWHVSLPTEEEWEKAARDSDGRIYPWGNEPRRDRAVFQARGPAPVGSIPCPECAYGLSDMAGNVWEWTRSPYQPYPYDESDDRTGLDADALWSMRGGSFNDDLRNLRAAERGGADPGVRRPFIGFRVALTK